MSKFIPDIVQFPAMSVDPKLCRAVSTVSNWEFDIKFKLFYLQTSPSLQETLSGRNSFWPGCSKLTTSLVNVSLKFQMLISDICQYFL